MPTVISLKDGKVETLFAERDFEYLIDKHMGMDCANYYQNQIEQLSECIRGLTDYIEDKDILAETEEVLQVHGY